ncbi:hypothetical protein [Rummeliibacillus sp. SL167]|nr:hypothetical protein [Rummeliibacillus sp. SL167]
MRPIGSGQQDVVLSIRPQESEQAVVEINESPYFYALNWIINTPDIW